MEIELLKKFRPALVKAEALQESKMKYGSRRKT